RPLVFWAKVQWRGATPPKSRRGIGQKPMALLLAPALAALLAPLLVRPARSRNRGHFVHLRHYVLQRPQGFAYASGHCRGHFQRFVDAAEIVEHEIERNRVNVVVELLAESVREPGEPPHGHAHGEVLALDIRGRNVPVVGIALDRILLRSAALAGAVAARTAR